MYLILSIYAVPTIRYFTFLNMMATDYMAQICEIEAREAAAGELSFLITYCIVFILHTHHYIVYISYASALYHVSIYLSI